MINQAQELYQIMSPMNIDSNKSKANLMITLDRPTNNENLLQQYIQKVEKANEDKEF